MIALLVQAEFRKLFSRSSARLGLVLSVVIGVLAPALLRSVGGGLEVNGENLQSMLPYHGAGGVALAGACAAVVTWLPLEPLVVDASAAPGDCVHRHIEQHRVERRCGRGVGDAHLAGGEQLVPLLPRLDGEFRAGHDRLKRLVDAHRRAFGHVCRAVPYLAAAQHRMLREVMIDAHIDHFEIGPGVARKHVDSRPAAQHIVHHLRRHLGGIG